MNDHRQVQTPGQSQLSRENCALHFARRVIVMIVEPNLAPGNHALALLYEINEPLLCLIVEQLRIVRMDADGCIDVCVCFSELDRALEGVAVRIAGADIEHRPDARVSRAVNYVVAVGVVFCSVDVAMRINEHHDERLQGTGDGGLWARKCTGGDTSGSNHSSPLGSHCLRSFSARLRCLYHVETITCSV